MSLHFVARTLSGSALVLAIVGCTGNGPSSDAGDSGPTWPMAESELSRDDNPLPSTDEMQALAADNHALTLDLYHQLRDGDAAGTGFTLSTYSIHTAFGMLYGGTVEPAATEVATTLHFSLPEDRQHVALNWLDKELHARNQPETPEFDPVIFETANGVWVQEDLGPEILPDYLDLLAVNYGTGVALADFQGNAEQERLDINLWVSHRTHELIPELFGPSVINSEITMVMVNALYLKAPWYEPFEEAATQPADFTRLDGSVVTVDMMSKYDVSGSYGEGTGYRALAIPLRGAQLEIVAVLPDDFAAFEDALDVATLDSVLGSLEYAVVTTEFPRFELELNSSLKTELQTLGLVTPFEDPTSFDGIMPGGPGRISDVIHKTMMIVDEKGVEAAAATGITFEEGGGDVSEYTIAFDRPFLVMVRDAPTGTLLFFGRVLDPSA